MNRDRADLPGDARLSPGQVAVRDHRDGPLLLAGPAGTGKSTALRHRLLSLTRDGLDPSRVALVTSTARAAAEHQRGLEAMLPGPYESLAVFTWEDLAETILRRWPLEAGLDPGFEVLGPAERLALLLVRFGELPLRHHQIRGNPAGLLRGLLGEIDRLKRAGTTARQLEQMERAAPEPGDSGEPGEALRRSELARLVAIHDRVLTEFGCLDRADLCREAAALLERNGDLGEAVAESYPHLIVDELEDLDPVRASLMEVLAGRCRSVVGADGSPTSGRSDSGAPFSGARTIELTEAWRLGAGRIAAARAVLGESVPPGPEPWQPAKQSDSIRFWSAETSQAEAQAVARDLEHQLGEGLDPGDAVIAVGDLNREGRLVATAFSERGIPARLGGGGNLFRQTEVRDALAWLRALDDPDDATAVTRALTRPPVELRSVDLAKLTVIARRRKLDLVSASEAALDSPRITPEARQRLEAFLNLYRAAAAVLDSRRPDAFVRRLIERVGFRRQRLFAAQPETTERLIELSHLADIAAKYSRLDPDGSTREFIRYLAALAESGLAIDDLPGGSLPGAVEVLEVGDLKGGEWRRVYLLGLDRAGDHDRGELAAAVTAAGGELVLSRVAPDDGGDRAGRAGGGSGPFERMMQAVDGTEEVHEEELFGPAEDLQATYRMMRDEVIEASWRAGRELNEPRLDTAVDVNRAIARYLELLKLAALAQRSGADNDSEAIEAVNGLLAQVATDDQRAELERSSLDSFLLESERERGLRRHLAEARAEPSLAEFLPRRGDDLRLSATDLDLYLTCPLKYKFARVFSIPKAPTINMRFGILVHNVLQRFHEPGAGGDRSGSFEYLMELLESGWRRAGFGESNDELQFRDRAREAMRSYWENERASDGEPVWLERQFEFKLGPHFVRGRVDRVDRTGSGDFEVIDYKTGLRVDTERLGGDIQLALYRLGAREAWDVEVGCGSYYYVLEGEKVAVECGSDDVERVERTVLEVGEGVLGQDFEPRPSPEVCAWCDYRMVCPASEA
ncbi:MAG: ATP-dependent helicase [Solirubrobacterales bacterium]|nr:ATP-dependent helicase [Solirubrobacterales bacterium]